jgi:putative tryptophan/tyrosine transport system substrate-binding protein
VKSTLARLAAAALLPLAGSVPANAQQAEKIHRIGFVSSDSRSTVPVDAFRQGLKEAGYVEGKNFIIEARYWEGRAERAPELVAEVLRLKVDVLMVGSAQTALAAKRATTTVPIVFASVFDPVATGLVASLARPGGNITGTTFGVGGEGFAGKWVELLKEALPGISHLAVLRNSANPASEPSVKEIQAAATIMKVKLDVFDAGTDTKLEAVLVAIDGSKAQAIIFAPDPFFSINTTRLVQFATRKRLPTMYYNKAFVEAGGFMSYGASSADSYRRAAKHVDRILKGAKPADLPVEQPTTFELVINLKTARALGLTLKPSLRQRADQVIE